MDRVTFDETILPRKRLSPQIERLTPGDSYHAAEKGEFFLKKNLF